MKIVTAITPDKAKEYIGLSDGLSWQDGKESARGSAKSIKSNFQAYPRDPNFKPFATLLNRLIMGDGVVKGITFPRQIVGVRANKYTPGDTYGWHVDFAHMNGARTDLSFTLFLSDPDSYDGGELETNEDGHIRKFKPNAGQMALYPTGVLHRVAPVTKGERIAIVGWISSLIPSEESRNTLVRMSSSMRQLKEEFDIDSENDNFKKLNYTYFQLTRLLSQ